MMLLLVQFMVLNSDIFVIVEKWLEMLDEIIQCDS